MIKLNLERVYRDILNLLVLILMLLLGSLLILRWIQRSWSSTGIGRKSWYLKKLKKIEIFSFLCWWHVMFMFHWFYEVYFADVRQFMSSSRSNPFRDSIESDIKSCSGSNEHKIERWRLVFARESWTYNEPGWECSDGYLRSVCSPWW